MPFSISQRGYSLIDLVTALGLSAILATLAAPSLSTLRGQTGLVSAQRDVMGALYVARSAAIASNTPRRVVLTPPTQITITDQSGTTTYYRRDFQEYGAGVSIAGTAPIVIAYDARGLLNPPTTVGVTLTNQGHQVKGITVYPTGKPVAN
jgi:type II secretory pathway pseudopilin PulG